ncbi:hypothetical protein [Cryobacterium sp. TMT2-4]|uniref:hypothetical protein n=1 Tax=Cryobacterium sp. TMT2-4 TaxID=1259254 RepID=UPI0018E0A741|nr:hypothetical protein [Cryobacterium sp. TMT2-4]
MVEDLKKGALLPAIVIGAVLDDKEFALLPSLGSDGPGEFLPKDRSLLSIIDGMQRTAALIEAVKENNDVANQVVRVEFWLTDNVRAMIYRMLILNTGQVPWTISRQLSVVFAPLLEEIERNVPDLDKVSSPDRPGRRVGAAQYSSDDLVEMYIAFSLRKTAVDTKEAISDEFSRLDFVDNLADSTFQDQFYAALSMLSRLDKLFAGYPGDSETPAGRFVFDRQPARIGFIVAVGISVLGRPGADRTSIERVERMAKLEKAQEGLSSKLSVADEVVLHDFLRLDVLREVLDKKVGQVGRYERSVFSEAFKVLVDEDFELANLEPCWRAS